MAPVPRPTPRGIAVFVTAAALWIAGEMLGWPLARALAGSALGVLAAAVVVTLPRLQVDVRREVFPDRVECGRPALARLHVHNPTARRQRAFTAYDVIEYGDSHPVQVHGLPAGGTATFHYELPTNRRGPIAVGPLSTARMDPFGLIRRPLSTGSTITLRVYPRTHPARALVGGHPRHHHEGRIADDRLRGSSDLRDVREYVVGDEVRHLHWKATARTGQLMVRDYVDPDQPRFTVLLDVRKKVQSAAEFEHAVETAASLVKAAALAGHRCRLLTSAGVDVATAGGPAAVREMFDVLCDVVQVPSDGVIVPAALTSGGGGGCLVAVTGRIGGGDLRSLAAVRGRYARMYVMGVGTHGLGRDGIGVQGLPGLSSARAISAVDAEHAVGKWNAVVS